MEPGYYTAATLPPPSDGALAILQALDVVVPVSPLAAAVPCGSSNNSEGVRISDEGAPGVPIEDKGAPGVNFL
jgi:hypothetical protein